MRYHQVKMDEINEYIRDLWLKTYKGSGEYRHVSHTTFHCILPYSAIPLPSPPPLPLLYFYPDIDHVEIRSEDDAEETKMSQRRTYKYRVSHCSSDTSLPLGTSSHMVPSIHYQIV